MPSPRRRAQTSAFRRLPLGRPWCEALLLENGRKLLLRPIQPGDAAALRRSFGHLTAEEIRFRFLHPLTELTPEHARTLSTVDRQHGFALVLVEALPPRLALIGGVARAVIDAHGSAEFAIIVGREISGFGLGRHLLVRLIEWCRKKGLASIYGDVMIENQRMLQLARSLGFELRFENGSVVRIALALHPARHL
ncbi:MAG: N-acetyltransferase [Gammaproteobacteria bacterium HGW-Gammaproteobacteria-8]|nr:MAG: N-acetyltransferase [Gammaproteobacteria bacterium HGW-Gammaproteobacteria-8]